MIPSPIDLVVLAGGAATRLGELAAGIPKPLLPVAGAPFLAHVLDGLSPKLPLGRVVICARRDTGDMFKNQIKEQEYNIEITEECNPLGTGGAILSALERGFLSDPFLVINGDVLFAMDGAAVAAAAMKHGAALAVIGVPDAGRFGTVKCEDGKIRSFSEKNPEVKAGLISAGLYAFTHESLALFARRPCSFERDIAPVLAAEGSLAGVMSEGPFIDIGTPESLAVADSFVRRMKGG